MPYRILIPDELPYSSGVENVAIAIVSELLAKVDCVTWMRQDLGHIQRLKDRLGNPDNLNFIRFSEESPHSTKAKKSRLLDTLKETLKNIPLLQKKATVAYRRLVDARIAGAAKKSRATHCWYHFVQGQSVPKLDVPVCGLVHDQNFRFYPEKLSLGKPRQFKLALHQWLQKADMITVLSNQGRKEMLELESDPRSRIEIIPNAITPNHVELSANRLPGQKPTFLYPAAALSHKNHLGLFKAAKHMALNGQDFKIVICGEGTDLLISRQPMGNQGAEQARAFYEANRHFLEPHIQGLGQCSMQILESHYKSCNAVILPSLYEGFGLPLVEALSRNIPVLCNRIIPFEEQVERYNAQDWVKWFDATDAESIAHAIKAFLRKIPDRNFPMENLQAWTWKDVVARYMEIFEELSK